MGDSVPRLNPLRTIYHIGKDKKWKKLDACKLLKKVDLGEEELFEKMEAREEVSKMEMPLLDKSMDEFTVGQVLNRAIHFGPEMKSTWNENPLTLRDILTKARVPPTKYFGDYLTGISRPVESPSSGSEPNYSGRRRAENPNDNYASDQADNSVNLGGGDQE